MKVGRTKEQREEVLRLKMALLDVSRKAINDGMSRMQILSVVMQFGAWVGMDAGLTLEWWVKGCTDSFKAVREMSDED